jgi:hypothetical protein
MYPPESVSHATFANRVWLSCFACTANDWRVHCTDDAAPTTFAILGNSEKDFFDSGQALVRFPPLPWHYKANEREQSPNDRKLYAAAENEAKAARRGLWADEMPLPPWEFRHRGK